MTDGARPPRSDVRGRALAATASVAIVAAAVLAWLAVAGRDVPDATLQVAPATAVASPSTIAPRLASTPDPGPTMPSTPVTFPPGSGAPRSPPAEVLGRRGSALPSPPVERVGPATVTIDAIGLWAPARPVGLEDDGSMEIPDETEVGWYDQAAAPGEPGATVLAAHVTWNGTVGPFLALGELEPGDEVRLRLTDRSVRVYEVVERAMYRKDALPDWRIFRRTGPESLVLITCGGSFNPDIRRYRENIVVYAVPIGDEPPPATPVAG